MTAHALQRCWQVLGLVIALSWSSASIAADHQDHIVERTIWEDVSGSAGVEQAMLATYAPLPNTRLLRRGYSTSAFWLRVLIEDDAPLVLRIQPPYLDDVRVFERVSNGAWRERIAGDWHAYADRESPDVAFTFAVQRNEHNQGVFYVRLKTTSSSIMDVQALSPRDSADQAAGFERFMGLNTGLVAGVLIWAVLQFFLVGHDRMLLRFIAYELITLMIALAVAGRLADTVFPDQPRWADLWFNTLVAAGTPVLAWFHRHYLTPYGLSLWAQWFLRAVIWVYPIQLVFIWMGSPQWAMQANALLAILCFFVFALEVWRMHHPDRWYWRMVRLVYGVLGLMLLPLVAALFGMEIPVQPALYGVTLHGAYGAVLMLLLLNMRLRQERQQAEQFRQDAALAQLQAAQEREHRQEQDQLLAMLAHEIKNPLAVIAMVVGSQEKTPRMLQQAGQAVQEVKSIVDQSLALEHVTRERAPQVSPLNVADVLADVADRLPELGDRLHTEGLEGTSIAADALWFKIVAHNLLSNALRYSPENATVGWTQRREGASWRIEVSNPVHAFPDAQRVFDKFYRGPSALKVSGTGLGLYVSRHLARRMGGDLLYEPTPERVRFTWLIPV
jgi:signal transduction histidine kinase